MRSLTLFRSVVLLTLTAVLTPASASAQSGDVLSITGTFKMNSLTPTVGDDLAGVFANGNYHWWRLTCTGAWVTHDQSFVTYDNGGYYNQTITRVHAASIALEFFGPDAAVLNTVVSGQLVGGGGTDGAVLELSNVDYWNPDIWEGDQYGMWQLVLVPEAAGGVWFQNASWDYNPTFATDADGYPLVQPIRLYPQELLIQDFRNGNSGSLGSYSDMVDLGSDREPLPPLVMDVKDASVVEGDKGTTSVSVTVTLNRTSDQTVSVAYQTVNGTAVAGTDYVAASGTLTFQPGQTSRTIVLAIKGDHKREPNETFTVRLSNAVGANINRGVATVTIINDD